jgi:alanyl-tRNA synthetase
LIKKREEIQSIILKEEKQFGETLEKWLKEFDRLIISLWGDDFWKTIPWDKAFKLFDTYWFPIEITEELARERWYRIDLTGYAEAFAKHQELSRTASVWKFKWWLADTSWETISLHTATHLMLAGLRKYLWKNVHQKWSNITPERIRFDFSNEEKVEKDILDKVEAYVNEAISSWFEVELREIPKEQAREEWVEWSFWEKYPEIVKVYTIKWKDWTIWSRELCWWPHVENSSNMWKFKIIKEEASSRWVRRIKAILEK